MRKEDRVRQQRTQQQPDRKEQTQQRQPEQVKGGASANRPAKPPRESGKLPLPE